MKQNLAMLQKQHGVRARRSTSIDAHTQLSIDACIQASIEERLAPLIGRLKTLTYRLEGVDFLTTRLDALQQEMVTIQRQPYSQAEPSPSIDIKTRPSTDSDYTARRSKLVTAKSLHDKLDEITFSQDLLKQDVYRELKDISETTYARLGMQQRSIWNLQHKMNASEVARERSKNQWTRGDEAIISFIGTWFQVSKDEVDTFIQPSGHFDHY